MNTFRIYGYEFTISEWARITGSSADLINHRHARGMTWIESIFTPSSRSEEYNGVVTNVSRQRIEELVSAWHRGLPVPAQKPKKEKTRQLLTVPPKNASIFFKTGVHRTTSAGVSYENYKWRFL